MIGSLYFWGKTYEVPTQLMENFLVDYKGRPKKTEKTEKTEKSFGSNYKGRASTHLELK